MNLFLEFIFIFFIGSLAGWIIELFFRRIVHGKWVNPGFLVGPYLPIYGFGLCTLTFSYIVFDGLTIHPIFIILLMGLLMTIIELIGGECFLHAGGVKLWDYSDQWGNYKGIICPQFSLIWTVAGALYYFFLAPSILNALNWFSNNLSFSFILGIFFGVIVLDYIYSTKLLVNIRKYAKDNNIVVKYEELKGQIKEKQKRFEKKYSFFFAFKQNDFSLLDALDDYGKSVENYAKKFFFFKKKSNKEKTKKK